MDASLGRTQRRPQSRDRDGGSTFHHGMRTTWPSHAVALAVSVGCHAALVTTLWIGSAPTDPSEATPTSEREPIWVGLAEENAGGNATSEDAESRSEGQLRNPPREASRERSVAGPARATRGEPRPSDRLTAVPHSRPRTRPLGAEPLPRARPKEIVVANAAREAPSTGPSPPPIDRATPKPPGAIPAGPETSTSSTAVDTTPGAGAALAGDVRPGWPGIGEVDRPARPRRPIRPHYPAVARRDGRESTVVVEAWVDDHGQVAFSSVLDSGGPEFDHAALDAIVRSTFRPARLEGRDVPSRVALRIHFALRD